ncbi:DNA-binding transcriptional repressor [Escherichia coli]|uniref:DNA-binding transcriptional repressor n=1 Tax=Escherichia coli TaxID=562 RepID=A0A376Y5C7_ECOLX|nr:DNA-binding transcriptional repressor [Escherichia coli]
MDREENELGVSCIAVPVFDIHGRVPYAVSISLSTSRLKQVGEKNLLKPLRETAQAISNELDLLSGMTWRDHITLWTSAKL